MAKRSTASSGTDPVGEGPGSDALDLGRRTFFRHLGRSALLTAGQVAGAADAVRRGATDAASGLLDAPEPALIAAEGSPASPGYHSSYRLEGDTLLLLDQRDVPERFDFIVCRDGRDVTRAIRMGAVRGGALLAQVAAYGLALTAYRHRERRPSAVLGEIDADMASLGHARPSARSLSVAMGRMHARQQAWRAGSDPADPADLADELRREADAIASEAMLDHAALAGHGASWLPRPEARALQLLLHGETGAMASGMIGTAMGIVQRVVAEGCDVHVWVTEGRPTGEGARITTWELRHAGVRHTILPDAAVGWLLQNQPLDAILLGAEWLAANGDAAVFAGGGAMAALASLAASHSSEPVPILLSAASSCFDPATPDGGAIPEDLRTGREAGSLIHPGLPAGTQVVTPAVDFARAEHIAAIATASGVLRPPFGPALAAAMTHPTAAGTAA